MAFQRRRKLPRDKSASMSYTIRVKNLSFNQKRILSEISLLFCGMVWGGSFVVTKSVMESLAPEWTLGFRFFFPALVLALYLRKRLLRAGVRVLSIAALSGALQFLGTIFQMIGLTMTTAGNSAFITVLYVVLVPFCLWTHTKKRPAWTVFLAGVICVLGVGFLVLQPGASVNDGDVWSFACAAVYAINIAVISLSLVGGMDALAFTCVQFFFTALPAFVMGAVLGPFPSAGVLFNGDVLFGLLYLIVACTIFAQIVHNVALAYADPSHASLIMGTEAVFGALCGALFLGEALTPRFIAGAALVASAIVLSEKTKDKSAKSTSVG